MQDVEVINQTASFAGIHTTVTIQKAAQWDHMPILSFHIPHIHEWACSPDCNIMH